MAAITTAREDWTCTHCKKRRPAGALCRSYVRNREKGVSCPGYDPRDYDYQTNCDFALRYVVEMSSPEGPKTICRSFRGIIEARRHAAVYTRTRLVACHVEGYPFMIATTRLDAFQQWANTQDWADQSDYHTEHVLIRPSQYGDLVWFRDERNAVVAKTVWGEPFSFS